MASYKNKRYEIQIYQENDPTALLIEPITGLTLDFTIEKTCAYNLNRAKLQLYNLSKATANLLRKDRFNFNNFYRIVVQLGVGDDPMYTVFDGNIHEAKDTTPFPDYVVSINAMEGGNDIQKANISQTISKGTDWLYIFNLLVKQCNWLQVGFIDNTVLPQEPLKMDLTLTGSVFSILQKYFGNNLHINNGFVNLIGNDAVVSNSNNLPVISKELIDRPDRGSAQIDVNTILMPYIQIAQLVRLESDVDIFNGDYKVQKIIHSGTISKTVASETTSFFELTAPVLNNSSFRLIV